MIKIKLVTIVVRKEINERLGKIFEEILAKSGEKVGFSDIIQCALDNTKNIVELIAEKLANHKRAKIDIAKKQVNLTDDDLEMIKK